MFSLSFRKLVGERYSHGIVFDLMKKLQNDHARLPLLGDGTQKKSYLYVKDGVRGIMLGIEKAPAQKNIYNLGHDYFIPVINVVEVVLDELGMRDVILDFAGGQRGWMGNSPLVHLDTTKLKRMGWRPEVSIEEGIRRTTRFLREILFSCMNAAEVQRRLIKFLAVWLRDGGTLNKLKTIAVI
jgi:UDP-glucose 4-epimerase